MDVMLAIILKLIMFAIGLVILAAIGIVSVVVLKKLYHTLCKKLDVKEDIFW